MNVPLGEPRDIEAYARQYAEHHGFEQHMVKYRRRLVLSLLERIPHRTVLEIGSGLDSLAFHLPGFTDFTICEPASAFLAAARQRAAGRSDIRLVEGFLEDNVNRLEDRVYDCIVASSVLHETVDPARFLAAVSRLCSRDTLIHFNVPNAMSLHQLLGVAMGLVRSPFERSERAQLFGRAHTFDLPSLIAMVTASGFIVIEHGSYLLKPFNDVQMQQMLDHGIIDELVLDALYEIVESQALSNGAEIYVQARYQGAA